MTRKGIPWHAPVVTGLTLPQATQVQVQGPFQRDETLNDKSTKPFEKSVEFFTLAPYLCELSEVWVVLINHV